MYKQNVYPEVPEEHSVYEDPNFCGFFCGFCNKPLECEEQNIDITKPRTKSIHLLETGTRTCCYEGYLDDYAFFLDLEKACKKRNMELAL